ncbi:uncharacterized protein LOC110828936 [Zootermopsis nevadensis]|uniref:uncharacterized protein LOC110828936 n=1 Tax=Zootermopsis nevadensis TaxID=136037 RepID=UPI000B8E226D|nr:uncharacterized protein LOC110828936 [Zootermopsis nevadensis]
MSGGPVRQLSLHLPPSTESRGPLRKQRSVDADRPWTSAGCNSGLRVTASSILTGGHFPQEAVITRSTSGRGAVARPRAVKVAWTDHRQEDSENVEVVVKRCTGQPRPVTCKPHLPSIGCDKDTILYTRQQLAERLRRAWLEREHSGRSLDIFLAHSNLESKEEEEEDSSADTKQSPSRVAEDRSLSASRNSVRYSKCAKKNAFPCAQNNLNSTLYISNAVGVSKNTPLKKNSAAFLRTSLSAQQCGTGVGKGEGDVLLARAPDEQEPVGAHNAAGDTPQIEVQGLRSSGLATIEITSSSAFRNADTAVSSNGKVQNHKNVEVNKSEVNPSNESAASSDKRNVETLARDVPRAINSHSSSRLCDAAEERDRGTEAVEVFSPRGKGSFSADSVRPGEASGNQRTEDEQERDVRANREETKQSNEVCVVAVSDKESCKLVQPPRARVTSTADVTPATARRVNYRNSLNNTITGSFSSDIPPSTKVCSSAPGVFVPTGCRSHEVTSNPRLVGDTRKKHSGAEEQEASTAEGRRC